MRVLLSGYYGFGNLGDEAILQALVRGLTSRGHDVEVLSGDPPSTQAHHGVAATGRYAALPLALGRADALISGGGGLLQDATSAMSLRYYLGVVRAARAIGLRTVVFGQSIGPLSGRGRRAVGRALRGVPVAVRDEPSRALLASLGVEAQRVADVALTLAPPAVRGGSGLLLIPRSGVVGARDALAELGRRAADDGAPVAVAALQHGDDARDAEAIAEVVPGARRLQVGTADEALAACAAADVVASVRLHGLVFAARAGTPHVGVAYDPKVDGFLRTSGGSAVQVPVEPGALAAYWTDARLLGARGDALGESLARDAEAGLDWLDRVLRDGAG